MLQNVQEHIIANPINFLLKINFHVCDSKLTSDTAIEHATCNMSVRLHSATTDSTYLTLTNNIKNDAVKYDFRKFYRIF